MDPEDGLAQTLADMFLAGGVFMYPLAALAVLVPLVAGTLLVVTAIRGRGALSGGLIVLGLVLSGFGLSASGEALGKRNVEEALAMADPIDRESIRAAGEGELLSLRIFAAGGAVIPGFLACVLIGLGLSQLDRFKTAP